MPHSSSGVWVTKGWGSLGTITSSVESTERVNTTGTYSPADKRMGEVP